MTPVELPLDFDRFLAPTVDASSPGLWWKYVETDASSYLQRDDLDGESSEGVATSHLSTPQ